MRTLKLHPDCEAGPVQSVKATLVPTAHGCKASFKLEGDIAAIKVPVAQAPERTDFLWKTTCLEIFWQPDGGSDYREFNLSPSSRWAAYDFDDFRENARDAPVQSVAITSKQYADNLALDAAIDSDLSVPAKVALNAIIEDTHGNIQYWALAFQDGKADFHSEVCRQLRLESR